MADTTPDQNPTPTPRTTPAYRRLLRALLPHLFTALVAIALNVVIQASLPRPTALVALPPTLPISTPRPAATALPTVPPAPTAPPPASGITRQELLDLRAEDDRIWSAIYLSRAISQVADAESALRSNDFDRTDQMIIATDDSLALAYARTPNTLRDPIAQLRRDAGVLREDLYLRPEGMDARLAQLRQTLLALIAERR
jgi:hypothetical protein